MKLNTKKQLRLKRHKKVRAIITGREFLFLKATNIFLPRLLTMKIKKRLLARQT